MGTGVKNTGICIIQLPQFTNCQVITYTHILCIHVKPRQYIYYVTTCDYNDFKENYTYVSKLFIYSQL